MGQRRKHSEIRKNLEMNGNENTHSRNLEDAAKSVLRGKSVAVNAYIKKEERSQISTLTLNHKDIK